MKQVIFLLAFLTISVIVNAQQQIRQGQQQQQRIDPEKLTPGWHADTSTIQINYKNLRYDPKGHFIVKYYMTPTKKPINTTTTLVDSTFKAVKLDDISDIKN